MKKTPFAVTLPRVRPALKTGFEIDHLTQIEFSVRFQSMKTSRPRSPTRRKDVIGAAGRLFARWGFDKTSVDDIAREAGVSKGAVYLEFPNKDALFKAVLYHESVRHAADLLQRFESDPGDWSFAWMFRHSLAAVQANPFMRALLTRDQRMFGSYLRKDPELFALKAAMGTEFFRKLQQEGAMRPDIPPDVLAQLLNVIGFGIIASADVMPDPGQVPFDRLVNALGLLLDRGLAPTRPGGRRAAKPHLLAMVAKMREALCAGENRP